MGCTFLVGRVFCQPCPRGCVHRNAAELRTRPLRYQALHVGFPAGSECGDSHGDLCTLRSALQRHAALPGPWHYAACPGGDH